MTAEPTTETVTVREALRLLWEANRYPHLGNEENRDAAQLEQEARAKARPRVPSRRLMTRRNSRAGWRPP